MIGSPTKYRKLAIASVLAMLVVILGVGTALAANPSQEAATQTRGLFGTVTAIGDFSLTVETKEGGVVELHITADTQFRIPNADNQTLNSVMVGSRIAAVAVSDGGVLTALKVQVTSSEPQRVHLTLTVVAVSGATVVAEDEQGNRVEVTLNTAPGSDIIGQTVKFVGVRGDNSELRASVQVQIQNIVERLQRHAESVRNQRDEQGSSSNADAERARREQEERLAKLKAQLEENMQRQLNVLAEVIEKLPEQARGQVRAALETIQENHVRVLQALSDTAEEEEAAQARIASRTAHGTVARIAADAGQVLVRTERESELLLTVNDGTVIRVGNNRGTLADIATGDRIRVEYAVRGDVHVALQLHIVTEASAAGQIVRADESGSVIVIQTGNNQTLQLNVTRETRIELNGAQGAPSDLQVGMTIKAVYDIRTLNAIAIGANTIAEIRGTLTGIYRDERVITVAASDGREVKLIITDNTRINIRGLVAALSSLREGALVVAAYNTLTSEALAVHVQLEVEPSRDQFTAFGQVTRVNADLGDFVVLSSEGRDLTLSVNSDTKILIGELPGTLSDIRVGDQARLAYIPAGSNAAGGGNVATHIQIQTQGTVYGTIARVGAATSSGGTGVVVFSDSNNRTVELNVTLETEIVLNGQLAALSQLQAGMNAKAAFNVRTSNAIAISASELAEATGTVTGVFPEDKAITVTTDDRRELKLLITSTTRISVNGRIADLASLLNGAKVHVAHNPATGEALSLTVRIAVEVRSDGTLGADEARKRAAELFEEAQTKQREVLEEARRKAQEVLREADEKLRETPTTGGSTSDRTSRSIELREQARRLLEESGILERNADRTSPDAIEEVRRRATELRNKAAELIRQADELSRTGVQGEVKDEVRRVVESTTDVQARVRALLEKADAVLRDSARLTDLAQQENVLREFGRELLNEATRIAGSTTGDSTELLRVVREMAQRFVTQADAVRARRQAADSSTTPKGIDVDTSRGLDSGINRDGIQDAGAVARQRIDSIIEKAEAVLRQTDNETALRDFASLVRNEVASLEREISATDVTSRARLQVLRELILRLDARAAEARAIREQQEADQARSSGGTSGSGGSFTDAAGNWLRFPEGLASLRFLASVTPSCMQTQIGGTGISTDSFKGARTAFAHIRTIADLAIPCMADRSLTARDVAGPDAALVAGERCQVALKTYASTIETAEHPGTVASAAAWVNQHCRDFEIQDFDNSRG